MAERVLAQMAVAFLLGVWGYQYQNYLVFICWACYLGWLLSVCCKEYQCNRQRLPRQAYPRLAWARIGLRLAACLLCLGLGYGRHHQHQAMAVKVTRLLEGADQVLVSGTIDQKEEKNGIIIYHLKDSFIDQKGRILCGRILIYHDADAYSIGDIIQVTGTNRTLRRARNEGNFDEASYEWGRGVFGKLQAEEILLKRRPDILWKEALYRLKRKVALVYQKHLSPQEAGVMQVMALGETSGLDPEIKELYQESGISHVLAISGLHISLLGMGVYGFLRKRGASYRTAGVLAGGMVLVFGQCSGMGLSAQRAVLMFLVLLMGNVLGMAYDSVTALSLAAFIQLWEYPKSLWQAGFLFSYGAVLAVVMVSGIVRRFLECQNNSLGQKHKNEKSVCEDENRECAWKQVICRIKKLWESKSKVLGDLLLISGCIQLVTLPISAYFYYEVPVYGLFANLLLLPFMGCLLGMGLFGGLLGLINDFWAGICLKPVKLLLGWNAWVCGKIGELPNALWITGRPNGRYMAVYYVCLAAALYGMDRWTKRKRAVQRKRDFQDGEEPKSARQTQGRPVVFAARGLLLLGLSGAVFFLLETAGMRGRTQVCFLDVGQGDGVFFQAEGAAFFLDGGSTSESGVGKYRILPFLKFRGFDSVEGWFVSHGDQDHIGGLKEVWEEGYHIKRLFLAEGMVRDEAWQELCRQAEIHGTKICYLSPKDAVGTPSLRLACLYPWSKGEERNEASMVLKMELWEKDKKQKTTGVFAGDIGEEQERLLIERYPDLTANLYKASHHGSDGSNSREFLERLHPKVTIVSCGERNHYGHPGKSAVDRIMSCGSRIWYTKDSGQITIACKDGNLWIKEFLPNK